MGEVTTPGVHVGRGEVQFATTAERSVGDGDQELWTRDGRVSTGIQAPCCIVSSAGDDGARTSSSPSTPVARGIAFSPPNDQSTSHTPNVSTYGRVFRIF